MVKEVQWVGLEALRNRLQPFAPSRLPVLLLGETGCGKTHIARWIHTESRRSGALVELNCSGLDGEILASELFGHEKGAFTSAKTKRLGLFAAANNGTLFLDEIGDMPIQTQAKVLKVLEDGIVRPVGADRPSKVDVRLVFATNHDLRKRVAEGRFRQDLYSRIANYSFTIEPLRRRQGAIEPLFMHFLRVGYAKDRPDDVPVVHPDAIASLCARPWAEGNVRELEALALGVTTTFPSATEIGLHELHLQPAWQHDVGALPAPQTDAAALGDGDTTYGDLMAVVNNMCGHANVVDPKHQLLARQMAVAIAESPGWRDVQSAECAAQRRALAAGVELNNNWPLLKPLQAAVAAVIWWDLVRLGDDVTATLMKEKYSSSWGKGHGDKGAPFFFRPIIDWLTGSARSAASAEWPRRRR